jgi:hypothetical protein
LVLLNFLILVELTSDIIFEDVGPEDGDSSNDILLLLDEELCLNANVNFIHTRIIETNTTSIKIILHK